MGRQSLRGGLTSAAEYSCSPVTGLSCHRRLRNIPPSLTPASGRQDHTTSPSASSAIVFWHHPRPPHPASTSVTCATPPLSEQDGGSFRLIWISEKQKYFCRMGWTGKWRTRRLICPTGKSSPRALAVLTNRGLVWIVWWKSQVAGALVTFEPGARTAWHTHPLGQTLIVTSGLGWAQQEGGPVQEIRPGDVVCGFPRMRSTGMAHRLPPQ